MRKSAVFLILFIILGGVFFPLAGFAGTVGQYEVCDKVDNGACVGTPRNVCYEGVVPCGKKVWDNATWDGKQCTGNPATMKSTTVHCQLCHFFVMINGIINYIFVNVIPVAAVLMLVIAGVMFYFSGGIPNLRNRANKLIKGVGIGLALIYCSFMLVGIFLDVLGASEMEPIADVWKDDKIFSINCPVELPVPSP